MSDVIQTNIQRWRMKAASPEGLSTEEMREAIAAIRKERVNASEKSSTAKARTSTAKAKKAPVDGDALLGEIEDL